LQNKAYRIHAIFIETLRIHGFCKHPSKLEIRTRDFEQCAEITRVSDKRKTLQRFSALDSSDGDISDVAFYRTSYKYKILTKNSTVMIPYRLYKKYSAFTGF